MSEHFKRACAVWNELCGNHGCSPYRLNYPVPWATRGKQPRKKKKLLKKERGLYTSYEKPDQSLVNAKHRYNIVPQGYCLPVV